MILTYCKWWRVLVDEIGQRRGQIWFINENKAPDDKKKKKEKRKKKNTELMNGSISIVIVQTWVNRDSILIQIDSAF